MHDPMVQKNFGWLSRQRDVSVNSEVLEVAYNVLPVYLGFSPTCHTIKQILKHTFFFHLSSPPARWIKYA
ncbi:hypothetical protein LEMLEM_LOCUS13756, partial [Lemmus lemmus]